jgi:hypothetical protein
VEVASLLIDFGAHRVAPLQTAVVAGAHCNRTSQRGDIENCSIDTA